MPRIEPAFAIYVRLMLAFGVIFQLPTMVMLLARMGVITPRFMTRNFKYAVLSSSSSAAVPRRAAAGRARRSWPGPMLVLYIFSIGLAWVFGKKERRRRRGQGRQELGIGNGRNR